ncbi:hypothetical protein [Clostridium minihomine]|nr:hypothetical protein [Clostridium minihomine]
MDQTMKLNRPENLDDDLYRCLYSELTAGVDLDDLIFNGEEWYKSER